jgi:hypothetical protein
MYSQVCEDLAFLRRLTVFGRTRLIPLLQGHPAEGHPLGWQGPGGVYVVPSWATDVGPGVYCRLTQRSVVAWRQAARVLWPVDYASGAVAGPAAPVRVVYQSTITAAPLLAA